MAENKIPWIRFQKTFGCGTTRGQKVLDRFGGRPEAVFQESAEKLAATGLLTAGELKNMTGQGTEEAAWRVLDFCEDYGCQALTPDDEEYPLCLRQIYNFPAVLYVRGSLSGLDEVLAIAMVGTRRPSDYGVRAAERIAGGLAEKGAVIVSGLARGIDTVSHTAALKAGGKTIAVLGCGIDIVYPLENAQLLELIVRYGGAVVTEFPPETQPLPRHFPIRNRVISGLSQGVVIVEGSRRSGSLITAGHAYAQNRDVFAVPGSIFSAASEGPNYLLSQHAKAVDRAEAILEEYEYRIEWEPKKKEEEKFFSEAREPIEQEKFPPQIRGSKEKEKFFSAKPLSSFEESEKNGYNDERRPEDRRGGGKERRSTAIQQPLPAYLDEAQRKVYETLASEPRTADYIAAQSGLPTPAILSALTQLEIFGLVKTHPGRRFSLL